MADVSSSYVEDARTLAVGIDGQPTPGVELAAGDAFGLAALLGNDTGATLEAIDAVSVLVLDDEAISSIAARHPPVADALTHGLRVGPVGGRRLPRLTFGPSRDAYEQPINLSAADLNIVRRGSGAFPGVAP